MLPQRWKSDEYLQFDSGPKIHFNILSWIVEINKIIIMILRKTIIRRKVLRIHICNIIIYKTCNFYVVCIVCVVCIE